jgi:hypothetical protein
VGPQQLLRQFGPLLFFLIATIMLNWISGSVGPTVYNYSFQQTYSYPDKMTSYRLQQIYYVTPYTTRDFRYDSSLKQATDRHVEEEILNRLDAHCNEARRKRQSYENNSKRYSSDSPQYKELIKRSEEVDM